MIELIWDTGFKRAYKKRIAPDPDLKERFWDAMELFVEDPFAHVLRTHKLASDARLCRVSHQASASGRFKLALFRGHQSRMISATLGGPSSSLVSQASEAR